MNELITDEWLIENGFESKITSEDITFTKDGFAIHKVEGDNITVYSLYCMVRDKSDLLYIINNKKIETI